MQLTICLVTARACVRSAPNQFAAENNVRWTEKMVREHPLLVGAVLLSLGITAALLATLRAHRLVFAPRAHRHAKAGAPSHFIVTLVVVLLTLLIGGWAIVVGGYMLASAI